MILEKFKLLQLWLEESQGLKLDALPSSECVNALSVYLEMLQNWSKKVDLVALASPEELINRHLVDSYAAYLLIKANFGQMESCLDVGSGAGLPGLVFAILEPESSFYLCEPREKRQFFLEEVISRLRLGNVQVLGTRLEQVSKDSKYKIICSRALGMEDSFDILSRPLLRDGGKVCQLLGPSWNGAGREKPLNVLSYSLSARGPERKLAIWS